MLSARAVADSGNSLVAKGCSGSRSSSGSASFAAWWQALTRRPDGVRAPPSPTRFARGEGEEGRARTEGQPGACDCGTAFGSGEVPVATFNAHVTDYGEQRFLIQVHSGLELLLYRGCIVPVSSMRIRFNPPGEPERIIEPTLSVEIAREIVLRNLRAVSCGHVRNGHPGAADRYGGGQGAY